MTTEDVELITGKQARQMLGVMTPSTMYRRIHAGTFPKPVKLGRRSTRFVRGECEALVKQMIQERDREKAG